MYLTHFHKWLDLGHIVGAMFHFLQNKANLGFLTIILRKIERNDLRFGVMKYPDQFHNWLDFSYALLILQILVQYLLSGMWPI